MLSLGLYAIALTNGWWSVVRGPDLLTRSDNPRRFVEDRYVPRGNILDRANNPINRTVGTIGNHSRSYEYPALGPVIGYNHPKYGQAGFEAAFDDYLRGNKGNPASMIWRDQLLYGMSPRGLDVRLSIDLSLQERADENLTDKTGAVILLNPQTGEILVMASHPTFDPNRLTEIGSELNDDPGKPLINRAAQGMYPMGWLADPFAETIFGSKDISKEELQSVYEIFGFDRAPGIPIPAAEPLSNQGLEQFHVSPLQVALAGAALSNHGTIPAPIIAAAVNTPNDGWVVLSAEGTSIEAVQPSAADDAAESLIEEGKNFWSYTTRAIEKGSSVSWFIAGTHPNWQGSPLVVVVLLEENNVYLAQKMGEGLLAYAMNP